MLGGGAGSLSGIWEQFSIAAAVKSEIHLLGNSLKKSAVIG